MTVVATKVSCAAGAWTQVYSGSAESLIIRHEGEVRALLLTTSTGTTPAAPSGTTPDMPLEPFSEEVFISDPGTFWWVYNPGTVAFDVVTYVADRVMAAKPFALPALCLSSSLSLTTTTAAAIFAAGGAGIKNYITGLQAINTGAAVTELIILDGATERWRLTLPVNVPVMVEFPTELQSTAATALNANLSVAGTVRANFQGYRGP